MRLIVYRKVVVDGLLWGRNDILIRRMSMSNRRKSVFLISVLLIFQVKEVLAVFTRGSNSEWGMGWRIGITRSHTRLLRSRSLILIMPRTMSTISWRRLPSSLKWTVNTSRGTAIVFDPDTRYFGSYIKGSQLWIVMEYCGGASCADMVAHT